MPDNDDVLRRQNAALTRDLLRWIASTPRTYADAIETWRSTCPRHTIWEDAQMSGLIDHDGRPGGVVRLTATGLQMLTADENRSSTA
jgi:hypothetical protein